MSGPGVVNDDLTFELKTRPGKMKIALAGPTPGWSIRAVRYRGADVTDSGIEFRANENVTDIEVELTNRVTDLSGARHQQPRRGGERLLGGRLPAGSRQVDAELALPAHGTAGPGRAVQGDGPAAGRLPHVALDYVDPNEWNEPEYLERIRSKATSVTINEGETKSVDLKITRRRDTCGAASGPREAALKGPPDICGV